MYTSEWLLAAQIQLIIALFAMVVAHWWLRVPWRTTLLAVAFGNAIPVAPFPGFATWLYVQDFIIIVLLAGMIATLSIRWSALAAISAVALLIWPGQATLLTVFLGIPEGYAWVSFLYRRLAMVILILAIAGGSMKRVKAPEFLDTWLLIWGGMCIAALFHYFGVFNLDFFRGLERGVASIEEGAGAQRGFLGITRAGTGVLGSVTFAYCLALILFDPRLGSRRTLLCTLVGSISFVIVLFSGSRTGFVACMVSVAYLGFRSLQLVRSVRMGRILLACAVAGVLLTGVVARGMAVVGTRLQLREGLQSGSFQMRLETQKSQLRLTSRDMRVAMLGIGGGTGAHFRFLVGGLSHSHNDYLQFMWEGGIPGFVLFIIWLFLLFHLMRPGRRGHIHVLGVAGQGMMLAGLVMGMTEGHLAAYSSRMITPSLMVLVMYSLIIRELQETDDELQQLAEDSDLATVSAC